MLSATSFYVFLAVAPASALIGWGIVYLSSRSIADEFARSGAGGTPKISKMHLAFAAAERSNIATCQLDGQCSRVGISEKSQVASKHRAFWPRGGLRPFVSRSRLSTGDFRERLAFRALG